MKIKWPWIRKEQALNITDEDTEFINTRPLPTSNNSLQRVTATMADIHLAIEKDEFVFPEFSTSPDAKELSLKALSVARRLFSLPDDND